MIKDKKLRKKFPASVFKDCREISTLTAAYKAGIIADWEQFVVWRINATAVDLSGPPGDFGPPPPRQWTARLYHAFNQYFGHIAHFSRNGFYEAQMLHWVDFRRNLREAAEQEPYHYNTWGAYRDCVDLNHAMRDISEPYLNDHD